jgi:hypothetical protein
VTNVYVDIVLGILCALAVASTTMALRGVIVLRDLEYARSMIFLRFGGFANLFSLLFLGGAVPLAIAMAFMLLDDGFHLALFEYISLAMFALFFAVINYAIILGARIVWGSK